MPQNSPELAGCQLGCLGSTGPGCSGVSGAAGIPGSQRRSRLSELEGPTETSPRPLLTDQETEAQRAEEASPKSRSKSAADAGFKPHFPGSSSVGCSFRGPVWLPLCLLFVLLLQALLCLRAGSGTVGWRGRGGRECLEAGLLAGFPALARPLAQGESFEHMK